MVATDPQCRKWRLYGADQPTAIAAGHSHVACMLAAIQDEVLVEPLSAAVAYGADLMSGPPSGRAYWDFVLSSSEGKTLVISWNGNQHQAGFLIAPDPPIRLHNPHRSSDPDGYGVWVPREMLRAHWEPTFEELDEVLRRANRGSAVIILGTPPPKRDRAIRASLSGERLFRDYADQHGIDLDRLHVTPELDRLAMWNLLQEMLRARADGAGARFLPVPAAATDSDGFLLDRYAATDATHANAAYGALLWSEIAHELNARTASA